MKETRDAAPEEKGLTSIYTLREGGLSPQRGLVHTSQHLLLTAANAIVSMYLQTISLRGQTLMKRSADERQLHEISIQQPRR